MLEELGLRLRQIRLARNLTQAQLAEEAGVSAPTVNKLESGGPIQLVTLIRVLRVLGLLDGLEATIPEAGPSPVDQFRRRGRERKRASSARHKEPQGSQAAPWRWGDEERGR